MSKTAKVFDPTEDSFLRLGEVGNGVYSVTRNGRLLGLVAAFSMHGGDWRWRVAGDADYSPDRYKSMRSAAIGLSAEATWRRPRMAAR